MLNNLFKCVLPFILIFSTCRVYAEGEFLNMRVFLNSGVYIPTPGATRALMIATGGGGGGGGSGGDEGMTGGTGGETKIGSIVAAPGGAGGSGALCGGAPATGSQGDLLIDGSGGGSGGEMLAAFNPSGLGGGSFFGGGAPSGHTAANGKDGKIGGGGSGGGGSDTFAAASGGGAGGTSFKVTSPLESSYSITIGQGGEPGPALANGFPGGRGGSGLVVIFEFR